MLVGDTLKTATATWLMSHLRLGDEIMATKDISDATLLTTFLIHPGMWNAYDQRRANREGWIIGSMAASPGFAQIIAKSWDYDGAATPMMAPFVSNLQAAEHVQERAHQGSDFHQRAWQAWAKCFIHGCGTLGEEP